MSKSKGGFKELFYGSIMPKIYGIGASVVILGAMFKILHLGPADIVLGVGLSTEAIIFFLSAFEPKPHEDDWSRVYPELSEDYDGPAPERKKLGKTDQKDSVSKKLDHMLESNKIGPELIQSLGQGMKSIADNAKKMNSLGDASVATNEYSKNIKDASNSLVSLNKSYGTTVQAMGQMANASKDAKEYHTQVQSVTKNLGLLNAMYEVELKDANTHLKAMNKFYGSVSTAMDNIAQAGKESEQFRTEVQSLTKNLSQLNKVYGSMLTAMKG